MVASPTLYSFVGLTIQIKKTTYPKYSVQSLYIWSVDVLTINIKLSIQASTVLSVQVIVVRVDY